MIHKIAKVVQVVSNMVHKWYSSLVVQIISSTCDLNSGTGTFKSETDTLKVVHTISKVPTVSKSGTDTLECRTDHFKSIGTVDAIEDISARGGGKNRVIRRFFS